ncbi:glycosyltransferase [Mucilaginibacter sp. Bleaf8]|uniref:glycosyltransferase family 2 protein n=1 Tax=Mucilaginibacter sp. Bleaf8 TaxID=2834430 RepID=UPI001BCC35AD|nr:glycosyltransferase [Mucilaginibacter sp. Bleaf8]MBS7562852.1 glycosyltransferase [Mucilaginibacter sp. Bleaf8]
MPKISVILPVYNTELYIKEAVDSILNQTFKDFELLVINDASTDNTLHILQQINDDRLKIINNETNLKVVKSLNKGLDLAQGEYIARMDADDIAHPQRFEKQLRFFETNPDVDFVGSWVQTFGSESNVMKAATEHDHIKVRLFFLNPIFHPAVMFKKQSFNVNGYRFDERFTNAEDYGMWVKAIDTLKFANVPEILLKYRVHNNNVSVIKASNRAVLDEIHYDVYKQFLSKLDLVYTDDELQLHRKLGLVEVEALDLVGLEKYLQWLKKLVDQNNRVKYFEREHFKNVILSYVLYVVKKAKPSGPAFRLALKTFGNLFTPSDFWSYFTSRAKVKLAKAQTF